MNEKCLLLHKFITSHCHIHKYSRVRSDLAFMDGGKESKFANSKKVLNQQHTSSLSISQHKWRIMISLSLFHNVMPCAFQQPTIWIKERRKNISNSINIDFAQHASTHSSALFVQVQFYNFFQLRDEKHVSYMLSPMSLLVVPLFSISYSNLIAFWLEEL